MDFLLRGLRNGRFRKAGGTANVLLLRLDFQSHADRVAQDGDVLRVAEPRREMAGLVGLYVTQLGLRHSVTPPND